MQAACRPALPIPMDSVTANGVLFSGPCLWRGWNLTNKNAGSGDIELFDGQDINGTPIAYSHQASGGNAQVWLGDAGLYCAIGLYATLAVTPWRGAVYFTPLSDHELDEYYSGKHASQAGKGNG